MNPSTIITTHHHSSLSIGIVLFTICNVLLVTSVVSFTPRLPFSGSSSSSNEQTISTNKFHPASPLHPFVLHSTPPIVIVVAEDDENDDGEEEDEEEEEEEEEELDPYTQLASSEFADDVDTSQPESSSSSALIQGSSSLNSPTTNMDWGGALGRLRERVEDVESGVSKDPSQALFRVMSAETPNQMIGKFVSTANPQVVQAMSGAVSSLLGGLSRPASGVETLVKASGEKIGSLCFQLQMTGYMFRNAEYVLALKDLLKLRGKTSLEDYKEAFERIDSDGSGYIEASEVKDLLDDVYEDEAPAYEIDAFLQFFDQNQDGKISWEEFEQGFAAAMDSQTQKEDFATRFLAAQETATGEEDEDDELIDINTDVSGTIEVELESGKYVKVEAKEYIESLKKEAQELKAALRREKYGVDQAAQADAAGDVFFSGPSPATPSSDDLGEGIVGYIASRQGDVQSLTKGVSPEVMDTMKKLVDFVLEGGQGKGKGKLTDEEKAGMEMEIPGSALQQLALWQLVLGYRLRESEVKGEYRKLLK